MSVSIKKSAPGFPVVTLSAKYQVVIPEQVRQATAWRPGQKFMVFSSGDQLHLVPLRPIEEYRGIAPGIDTRIDRSDDPQR